jgi:hypothetical protein
VIRAESCDPRPEAEGEAARARRARGDRGAGMRGR